MPRLWTSLTPSPSTVSLSESTASHTAMTILSSIIASSSLDEISNIDSGEPVRDYIRSQGRVDDGVMRRGIMFWFYPTGFHGPWEVLEEDCERGKKGDIVYHGLLVTIEANTPFDKVMETILKVEMPSTGLATVHIFP